MTIRLARPRPTRMAAALTAVLCTASLAGLAGCSGDDGDSGAEPWSKAGAEARRVLDETSGIEVSISTDDDPGVDYLAAATGTIVADPPAFEGTVDGSLSGFPASGIPVISVDGTLWIEHDLLGGWSDQFQPDDLCAPDPAGLLDPDTGVAPVLTEATGVSAGKSERGGADNKEILTSYSGTVPGDAVRNILPCSDGEEFDATFRLDDEGRLRTAVLTGVFFKDATSMTYTIDVTGYDVEKDIQAPR